MVLYNAKPNQADKKGVVLMKFFILYFQFAKTGKREVLFKYESSLSLGEIYSIFPFGFLHPWLTHLPPPSGKF